MLEIDLATPELRRLVGRYPALDQIARNLSFSEGPAWDRRTGDFYYIDIVVSGTFSGAGIWRRGMDKGLLS